MQILKTCREAEGLLWNQSVEESGTTPSAFVFTDPVMSGGMNELVLADRICAAPSRTAGGRPNDPANLRHEG